MSSKTKAKARSTKNSTVGRNPDPQTYKITYLFFDVLHNPKSEIHSLIVSETGFKDEFAAQRGAFKALLLKNHDFRAKASSIHFFKVSGTFSPAVVRYVRS